MSHELHVWADARIVAHIRHDARDDHWSLSYDSTWSQHEDSFPLSPALPIHRPANDYSSASLKRFIEHLLPEGRALDVAVAYNGITKTNVFGLILSLGADTAGALRFTSRLSDELQAAEESAEEPAPREIPTAELEARIARHEQLPLSVWDGKVRMSVAGLQDKLLVYIDKPLAKGGRLFIVDGRRLVS